MRIFCAKLISLAFLAMCCALSPVTAAALKDTESASHGYDAARHQIVDRYKYTGFEVVQYNLAVLSHYSYVMISDKQALVIDPDRDIDTYLDLAQKEGLSIKGVFLTHSHADFVAGHLELVKATGCPIYQSADSKAGYKIEPMKEGSEIQIGLATIKFLETPGHTPDGMCALVYGTEKKDTPEVIFTGDMLFVGSIGRPDLIGGDMTPATLASMSYDTWNNKLAKLVDSVVVFPAHGAGSLCGAHLSDKPSSTIGQERVSNPYVQHQGRSEFVAAVLEGLPEAPQYFKHNAAMNRQGPELVDSKMPLLSEVTAEQSLTDTSKYYVVDIRDAVQYADNHIPNSVNIGLRGRLETWVGIMVPWEAKLVLVGNPDEFKEAIFRLHRVGYQAAVITPEAWTKSNLPVNTNKMIKPAELYELMQKHQEPVIVDVRLPSEWIGLRIGIVINLPLNHLAELSAKLDSRQPVVTVCNSAYRSSMAVGVLEGKGFKQVSSMDGGSEAWIAEGFPVYGAEAKGTQAAPTATQISQRVINLPERICAAELNRLIMDLPGTFDLVDIRPPTHFSDYRIPGSRNVDIAELLNNPAFLTGAGPLIIVDRDGTLSMAVGGILSQKTQRTIKAVFGGVEAYWSQTDLGYVPGGTGSSTISPSRVPPATAPTITPREVQPAVPPATPVPQPTTPPATKKKSVGC